MPTNYPGAIDTFSAQSDGVDDVLAADMNDVQDPVNAIETELGTDPAGTATDVKTRLARSLDGAGNLSFADETELTISAGVITVTQNYHSVDTEADAASDDLDTINGLNVGAILVIVPDNGARTIVAKDGTGNLILAGDFTMATNRDTLTLLRSTPTRWIELSRSQNN